MIFLVPFPAVLLALIAAIIGVAMARYGFSHQHIGYAALGSVFVCAALCWALRRLRRFCS